MAREKTTSLHVGAWWLYSDRALRAVSELPLDQLHRAVAVGLAQSDPALRAQMMLALRDRVSLRQVVRETWSAAERAEEAAELEAFRAARAAAVTIVGEKEVDESLSTVRLIWSSPEHSRWLKTQLPKRRGTAVEPDAALEKVSRISDPAIRARSLGLIAPLLMPSAKSVAVAKAIHGEKDRARALSVLGATLSAVELPGAIEEALRIAQPEYRALALGALVTQTQERRVRWVDLMRKALVDAAGQAADAVVARTVAALVPGMQVVFPELTDEIREAASRIVTPFARKIAAQALRLPSPQAFDADLRANLIKELVGRVQALGEQKDPEIVLEKLSDVAVEAATPSETGQPPLGVSKPAISGRSEKLTRTGMGGGYGAGFPGLGGVREERTVRWADEAPSEPPPPTDDAATGQPERIANLGFTRGRESRGLPKTTTLARNRVYNFWVEIGARQEDSIATKPEPVLPKERLPNRATLDVVVYSMNGGFFIAPSAKSGQLIVGGGGTIKVARQPGDGGRSRTFPHRLYFTVIAPKESGSGRLRCSIYYQGNLVQSHLVHVKVTDDEEVEVPYAQEAVADYSLSSTLALSHLRGLKPQQLSIMMNKNADGSHGFTFFAPNEGRDPFTHESNLQPVTLQSHVRTGRAALRKASWGNVNEWQSTSTYRYAADAPPTEAERMDDLKALAAAGYRLYDALITDVAGGLQRADELTIRMRSSGFVQVSLKEKANHVFPASLLYDHPLDSTREELEVCRDFLAAMSSNGPLHEADCLTKGCANYGNDGIVCPSGFWGYRHAIGLPLSTPNSTAATTIALTGGLAVTVLTSTDPQFIRRVDHLNELKRLCAPQRWETAETRADAFTRMKSDLSHLVYCFVHGGLTDAQLPFIVVGPDAASGAITIDNFGNKKIRWSEPRPLVFLNGCHTTALEPDIAINFVDGLLDRCAAAGVIGTEITVFEQLACIFAEECMRSFFAERQPIGEAVRRARLALLKRKNPLGLVYIPFVQPGLEVT